MKMKGYTTWIVIIVVLLLLLFIVQCLLKKKSMSRESFIPNVSSNTPTGSSQLYGWSDSTYNNLSVSISNPDDCCTCPS